jgi:hypothetical protein
METHANAIQTMIDNNYINVLGGGLTEFFNEYNKYPLSHFILIMLLSLIAFSILSFANPIIAGFLIIFECLFYFAVACGLFIDDLFWGIKAISPKFLSNFQFFQLQLPQVGESMIVPVVAPLASVIFTYFRYSSL